MTKSFTFAKGVVAAAAGLMALGVAAGASAQQPYYGPGPAYGGGYYPCQRDANDRGLKGGLVGAAGGAVLGSQFAASGHRSDGSLLGGVVGALAGAAIGHSSAACNPAPPPRYERYAPPPVYYEPAPLAYEEDYDAPPPPPVYAPAPVVWVYGRHGARFRVVADRMGRDGCTLAESPVYLPDGRVDRRFVRVCPDYSGRYYVVD